MGRLIAFCAVTVAFAGFAVAIIWVGREVSTAAVNVRPIDVNGTPCIVANDPTGVAITCNWSKSK